ncbi:unnamed protein product [Phyllotreta striolata]|uniref:AB hydrolase-1 domain-containing protein n=1 Tax=Phyllotreta striolata TaxID=444603 RepID=A0A9N9TYN3_PHYSR|nr:unnamed protein product [Phyllotreta striolata]
MSKVTLQNGHEGASNYFEETKIPVPWGHISGKWWGDRSRQPVIGIHGWQDNSSTFDNLAPLLAQKGVSFLCVDLPGHGFSSHLPPGVEYYLWWDGVHFLRRIVRHFGWKDVTLIGHSLGGGISFLYASIYPEEVSKYVSIDIASPSVRSPQKQIASIGPAIDRFFDYEAKTADMTPYYTYEDMVDIMEEAHKGSVDRAGCEVLLRRGMKPAYKEGCFMFTRDPRLKLAALGFFTLDQAMEFASRITCEVLNIKADKTLRLDNPEYYDLILDKIEESAEKLERHLVEGTHHVHLTDAARVAPIIINFLLG